MSTEAQVIVDTARTATVPVALELGKFHVVSTPSGVQTFDLTGDAFREFPARKKGTVTVRDVPSFLAYFDKHGSPSAEVFADRDRGTVTGILDAHKPYGGQPEWQQHRVVLQLRHTPAFEAWKQVSGQLMSQTRFAEFIEDHRGDIVEPSAADMLELAQTFQATTKVAFKSSSILKSGQRQLSYVESIDATAGHRGNLAVPDSLQLGLAVYEGATVADEVTARLRFRIDSDGRLALGVVLDQLAGVVQNAFEGVLEEVGAGVPVSILRGAPA